MVNNNGFWIRWLDLLALFTITISYNSSQLMAVQDSLHSLLHYECFLFCVTDFGHFLSFRCPLVGTPQLNTQLPNEWIVQSHIATDGQSASKSWSQDPSGAHDQIFITVWQLRSCFYRAPSLTRGRVCFFICCWPCQRSLSRVQVLLAVEG
jgi:hypothetical protein